MTQNVTVQLLNKNNTWVDLGLELSRKIIEILTSKDKSLKEKSALCTHLFKSRRAELLYNILSRFPPSAEYFDSRKQKASMYWFIKTSYDDVYELSARIKFINSCFDSGAYIGLARGQVVSLRRIY